MKHRRLHDYVAHCEDCGVSITRQTYTKALAAAGYRAHHWKQVKGEWYCPYHIPFGDKAKSAAEFARYWALTVPSIVPTPMREIRFSMRRQWRFDFAWLDHKVAVEMDGGKRLVRTGRRGTMVGGRHNSDDDDLKLNVAAARGWRVFRFSDSALKDDPLGCISLVLVALGVEHINTVD